MLKGTQRESSAEACLREALEIAAQQGARFWELRSAISLARFRMGQGRSAEAEETLRNVYGSFSEGFDIADMRTARGLIDQLRS
jgi:predicted ATPase